MNPNLLVLMLLAAAATGPSADELLRRVQLWIDGTRELQARFEQSLRSEAFGTQQAESGVLYLSRPGRMRWDYERPERKVALVFERHTELYLPEERQLQRGELEPGADLLPVLLAGSTPLAQLFDASLAAGRLRLTPRAEGQGFQHVTLSVRDPDGAIEGAEVVDAAGNVIEYRFRGLRRNRGLPAALFRFEPPPGTEILGAP
ncbi:MAG TPA: outer membrane lipoprotein carrier protein LolA [Candidatus Polarisedimenticolaceae bacterium]|nr:outer membrane lipoprotein carrier protein LolA [Candidatus Polarisedimenticolaceae bacterium]